MAGTCSTQHVERRRPVDVDFLMAAARIADAGALRPVASPRSEHRELGVVATLLALVVLAVALVGIGAATAGPACPRVAYVVDSLGAPLDIGDAVEQAFARFAAATGVDVAVGDRATTKQVVIGWAPADRFERRGGNVAAGYTARGAETLTGLISLNADFDLPAERADGPSWASVLMHELGHIAGLAHSAQKSELMFPTIGAATWGHEDLARLRAAGERWGCRTSS